MAKEKEMHAGHRERMTEKLIENEFSFVLQIMPEKVSEYIKETLNNK